MGSGGSVDVVVGRMEGGIWCRARARMRIDVPSGSSNQACSLQFFRSRGGSGAAGGVRRAESLISRNDLDWWPDGEYLAAQRSCQCASEQCASKASQKLQGQKRACWGGGVNCCGDAILDLNGRIGLEERDK